MGKLFAIRLIEAIVSLYDILTLPAYYLIQKPWQLEREATKVRARQAEPNVWTNIDNKLDKSERKTVETLDQLFRESVATYASRPCLGVRDILAVEYKHSEDEGSIVQNGKASLQNGATRDARPDLKPKVISKYVLDDKYTWFTYKQIEQMVVNLSKGLTNICSDSLENSDGSRKLLICADTCMQWFLMAHTCFRNNITVVTAYTTLEDDAILHSIHQTEVKILVVSQKFAKRLPAILAQSPLVDTVIVLDRPLPGEIDELANLRSLLGESKLQRAISYDDLQTRGSELSHETINSKPTPQDVAVLMYTSGSTGKPKGVMLSQSSIVYTALAFSGPGDINHEDRYIGYLPLGHVLELAAECIFLRNGSTIAYSSPLTLTSASPMVKRGQHGDAYIFKPTIMGAVPLVLDRVRSSIQYAVKSQGPFYDQLINDFVVRYKRYWYERYYSTPIMNWLICRKFNRVLGGEIRAICSGGAALSRETQEYLRHVTNYIILQGYGLTETSAAASFCDIRDRRYNVVGPPYPIVHLKLESWSDYSVDDKPNPRGEIIIGGQPVALGYYKNDELTRESFYTDPKTGMRFFRTGDIGVMLPDGCLKIIDRKKDIVKPLSGEYISLNEIEIALRTAPIIENICVYCSQYSNYLVAIVKPDPKELRSFACQLFHEPTAEKFKNFVLDSYYSNQSDGADWKGSADTKTLVQGTPMEALCSNNWFEDQVLKLIQAEGARHKLKKNKIPSKIKLVTEEWSPESGFVTASFKLKRREVERHYAEDIKRLYAELGQNIDQGQSKS